jgi:UDP-N-acetylmuramyl tripeptide synthase
VKLSDSRRLMGPNLLLGAPAAVVDVELDAGEDPVAIFAAWEREARRIAALAGLPVGEVAARAFAGGASMAFAAPIDRLLPATDVNEAAIALLADGTEPRVAELRAAVSAAESPRLLALARDAAAARLLFLWDDEQVTVGAGRGGRTFPRAALPDALPPAANVPVALVTGTNGKTTSVRLAARILRLAGRTAGCATTDAIAVDEQIVDRGDYTGPDAARLVLRDPRVEVAVLETARGGILRRGLAVPWADAALLTNVAGDHLGGYGIDDVPTMARVKGVVGAAVRDGGTVVVNGDDALLVDVARSFRARVEMFSLVATAPWRVDSGWFVRGGRRLLRVEDAPIAFGGAAAYNAANALGAAALTAALGAGEDAIVEGLRSFASDSADNPGRGNVIDAGGIRLILDFGHNPEAVRAVLALARSLRGAGRLGVVAGQPGDRRDDAIRAVGAEIGAAAPDRVFVHELRGYERGREPGVVPALLAASLGVAHEIAEGEVDAIARAFAWARPGDVIVVMPHLEREAVRKLVDEMASR